MNIPLAILGLGPAEIILVLVAVLILFGANRLPQIGSSLGKGLKNFRKGMKGEGEEEEEEAESSSSQKEKTPSTKKSQ